MVEDFLKEYAKKIVKEPDMLDVKRGEYDPMEGIYEIIIMGNIFRIHFVVIFNFTVI